MFRLLFSPFNAPFILVCDIISLTNKQRKTTAANNREANGFYLVAAGIWSSLDLPLPDALMAACYSTAVFVSSVPVSVLCCNRRHQLVPFHFWLQRVFGAQVV